VVAESDEAGLVNAFGSNEKMVDMATTTGKTAALLQFLKETATLRRKRISAYGARGFCGSLTFLGICPKPGRTHADQHLLRTTRRMSPISGSRFAKSTSRHSRRSPRNFRTGSLRSFRIAPMTT
jgi:hypothetical protein